MHIAQHSEINSPTVEFSRWRPAAIFDLDILGHDNANITSEMNSPYSKTLKRHIAQHSVINSYKVDFSRWRLAAIFDLCKLSELPRLAFLS